MEPLALPTPSVPPQLGSRALFPELGPRLYANHGAISPTSEPVAAAVAQVLADYAAHGVGCVMRWLAQRERLRGRLGAFLGVGPETLGYVPSTSHGVLTVAFGLDWRPGERILCFEGEFPTNVSPWQRAAEHFGLHVDFLPLEGFDDGSGLGLERVERHLRAHPETRLVAVSAVQFQTGLRMPTAALAELAHAVGAELFVDAIQAVGAGPLDLRGVDYLASGSHKWLMALEGAGFLYVAPGRMARLRPRLSSWLSHEEPVRFLFEGPGHLRYDRPVRAQADFTELGAPNTMGYAALEAALALLDEVGMAPLHGHLQAWQDAAEAVLLERGFRSLRAPDPAARSGILAALPPEGVDSHELVLALAREGVAATNPDGVLRLAPHWPNSLDEHEVLAAALDAALPGLRGSR